MPLDAKVRGVMEEFIDKTIEEVPAKIQFFRKPDVKKVMQIKDETEFIYGWAYGEVNSAFLSSYVLTRGKLPSEEERNELLKVFFRRIPEIKEAIFRAG